MADIASGNVAYTEVAGTRRLDGGRPPFYTAQYSIVFGNNTLTYPTGGIPLLASKFGMPQGVLLKVQVVDQGANAGGFKFEWDKANNKLLVRVEDTVGTNTPLKQHTNATFVPNPATLIVEVQGY